MLIQSDNKKGKNMNIYIENQYKNNIDIDYENLINIVVSEAIDYVKCPYECEVNVTIVDNDEIHEINNSQRNIDRPTDVLSFPMLEYVNQVILINSKMIYMLLILTQENLH